MILTKKEIIKALKELEGAALTEKVKPLAQAETFSRRPEEALASWKKRGYNVLGFNTKKYL